MQSELMTIPDTRSVLRAVTDLEAPLGKAWIDTLIRRYVGEFSNLFVSREPKTFFVWLDMKNPVVKHNIEITRTLSTLVFDSDPEVFAFIPNPKFSGIISFFQLGIMNHYRADYNLEATRQYQFARFPSRLKALFLTESKEAALHYRKCNPVHVEGRQLRAVHTQGPYAYSRHDATWVDFLRDIHSVDTATLDQVGRQYWSGARSQDCDLGSFGKPWRREAVPEVLFEGIVRVSEIDEEVPAS